MMLKNKKAIEINWEAILRLILLIPLIILVLIACNASVPKEEKYLQSFNDFVSGINSMSTQKKLFEGIKLEKKTAIIGFRKPNPNETSTPPNWKCVNCAGTGTEDRVFLRFDHPECAGSACACLCKEGFKFEGGTQKLGKCESFECKAINKQISDKTYVLNKNTYWQNGFLIVRDVDNANGLPKYTPERVNIAANYVKGILTVCTAGMVQHNIKNNISDSCIIPP